MHLHNRDKFGRYTELLRGKRQKVPRIKKNKKVPRLKTTKRYNGQKNDKMVHF